MRSLSRLSLAVLVGALSSGLAAAQDIKLPPQLSLTAYDTGTSGFNITVAVGQQLKKHGTDVRVLPAGNDTSRLAPLRSNRAVASAMGIGTYFAQEAMFEFGSKEWGRSNYACCSPRPRATASRSPSPRTAASRR